MKIIAMYLPQYHSFPENDEWWGKGYTEWTAVKRAKPLFNGHVQPKVPLDGYYDLVHDQPETFRRQAELTSKYGVYGFSIYQYWFKGHQLMEKPMEILLANPDIDLRYCITWANETWTRTWYGLQENVLMAQEYGDESDWKRHFDYNLQFFRDPRYIKVGNRPVFQIYRTHDIEKLSEMKECWDRWAREAGFDGLFWIGGNTAQQSDSRRDLMDGWYDFEPGYTLNHHFSRVRRFRYILGTGVRHLRNVIVSKLTGGKGRMIVERRIPIHWILENIGTRTYEENEYPGIIAEWDNTPRRDYKGLIYTGAEPHYFEKILRSLSDKVSGRSEDFVFINAWNEWGEGAMLEPTESGGYAWLEAVKRAQG